MVRPVEIGLDLLDLGGINSLSNVSAYRVFFPVSVRRFSHSVYLKSEVCVSLKNWKTCCVLMSSPFRVDFIS